MTAKTERILLVADAVMAAVCFLGCYLVRFWSGLFGTHNWTREGHYLIALPIFSILYLSSLWFLGGYETRRPVSVAAQSVLCLRAVVLSSLTFLSLLFWYRSSAQDYLEHLFPFLPFPVQFVYFSRVVILMNAVSLVVLSTICRTMILQAATYLRRQGFDLANALVITSDGSEKTICEVLQSQPELGYKLQAVVASSEILQAHPSFGSALYPIFDRHQVDDFFLDLGADSSKDAAELIDQCQQEPVRIHFAPRLYRDILPHPRWRIVDEGDWYTLERTAWDRLSQALKRATDIVAAITVLSLSSPLIAMIALGIQLTSRGPIIFRQERAGLNGRPFVIYKFRSMVEEAERQLDKVVDVQHLPQPVFKPENDPRVTSLGGWLRRFSLDELPQFCNVLRGQMSVVGPRPEELWIVERYDEGTRARLRVKPGITGYQQIRCRGAEDMTVRLNHDLYYIDHQSLFFDIYIILQTLWVVLSGKGRI